MFGVIYGIYSKEMTPAEMVGSGMVMCEIFSSFGKLLPNILFSATVTPLLISANIYYSSAFLFMLMRSYQQEIAGREEPVRLHYHYHIFLLQLPHITPDR